MSGTRRIPLAVVGCSDIFSRAHGPALARLEDEFELRAFCDTDAEKLAGFGRRYRVDACFRDIRELLAARVAEAALVATPTASHAGLSIALLDAGLDVLCEKPMALRVADAEAMIAAAGRNGRALQIALMSRHAPAWREIRRLAREGAAGEIHSVTLTQYWNTGEGLRGNWRTRPEISGGGIIADSAVHWIDILRWLLGEVARLTASAAPAPDSPRRDVEDHAFVLFEFASGVQALLRNSWRAPRRLNAAEEIEIYGTRGAIFGDLRTPWLNGGVQKVGWTAGGEYRELEFADPIERFAGQLRAFHRLIVDRGAGEPNAADGLRALVIQEAIYRAWRERRWVEV